MPGIQEFEPEYPQRVKRLWNAQFNARRDAEFGNLASVPVERISKYSEKEMDQAHFNVFQKAIAVQRAEAGAQKVSILSDIESYFDAVNREPEPLGNLRMPGRNFAERLIPLLEHASS